MAKILTSREHDESNSKKSLSRLVVLGLAVGVSLIAAILVFTYLK